MSLSIPLIEAGQQLTPSDVYANSEACGPSENLKFPSIVGYRIEDEDLYEFKLEYQTIAVASVNEMLVLGGSLEFVGDFKNANETQNVTLNLFETIANLTDSDDL